MSRHTHNFIRISAFCLLLLGLIITGALFTAGLTIAVTYPEGNVSKVILTSGACFLAGVLVLLPSIALFEVMLAFVRLEPHHPNQSSPAKATGELPEEK